MEDIRHMKFDFVFIPHLILYLVHFPFPLHDKYALSPTPFVRFYDKIV